MMNNITIFFLIVNTRHFQVNNKNLRLFYFEIIQSKKKN